MKTIKYRRTSEYSYFPGSFYDSEDRLIYKVITKNNMRKFEANILYPNERLFINIKRRGYFGYLEYKITFEDNSYVIVASASTATRRVFDLSYEKKNIHFEGNIYERSFEAYANDELIASVMKCSSGVVGDYDVEILKENYEEIILALIIVGLGERELSNT